jgi:hypothetical protein
MRELHRVLEALSMLPSHEQLVAGELAIWLANRREPQAEAKPAVEAKPAPARSRPRGPKKAGAKRGPGRRRKSIMVGSSPKPNGQEPPPNGAHRLDPQQRERLGFLLEHEPNEIRKGAGVALETARLAAGGAELAPEIIGRLAGFVAAG